MRSTLPELSYLDVTIRLLVAALLTGAVGLERELRERAAGLRTHMLVGVGSALFTIISAYAWTDFTFEGAVQFDPTRIAAQVVAGIGFLGAGVIIRQGLSVTGVTTAAGLWVVAGIGMAAGAGYFIGALVATAIVLIALGPGPWLERAPLMRRMRRAGRVLEVDLSSDGSLGVVLEALEARRAKVMRVEVRHERETRRARIEVTAPGGVETSQLVDWLSSVDGVAAVRTEL